MGKTHMPFGTVFALGGLAALDHFQLFDASPGEYAIAGAIGAVAGILPDIDHPESLLSHGVIPSGKLLGRVGRWLGFLLSLPPRLIGIAVKATMSHRGGTHSLTFLVLWAVAAAPIYAFMFTAIGALIAIAGGAVVSPIAGDPGWDLAASGRVIADEITAATPLIMVSVAFGYLAHLVSDSLTNVPVPWLWPFSKRRFFLAPPGLRIRTGGIVETTLVRPIVTIVATAAVLLLIAIPAGQNALDAGQVELERHQVELPEVIDSQLGGEKDGKRNTGGKKNTDR